MSVYKPKKSRFYHYEFRYKNHRFHGSTGVETRLKAEAVERKVRNDAALGLLDKAAGLTLDEGAGKWWAEVGQHLRTAEDMERRLGTLIRLMGKNTRLVDISTKHVAAAMERRRGETYTKAKPRKGFTPKAYPVSNATVNADIIGPLRRILRRADLVWEIKPLNRIDWRALSLAEPPPVARMYSAAQQAAWLAACDPVSAQALQVLLTYGLRLGELFFAPSDFDASGPRLTLNNRKAGAHMLPLRADDGRAIAARVGRAQAAGLKTIWFEEKVHPALGKRPERIELVPLTYYGLQARLRTAAKNAGLTGGRLIHGARHHAGTAMLAKTGNLKLTQQLLGHADIKSTLRYAHALEGDLRNALENGVSRNSPEPAPDDDAQTQGQQGVAAGRSEPS